MTRGILTFALLTGIFAGFAGSAYAVELEIAGLDGVTIRGRLLQVMPEVVIAQSIGETALAWADILNVRLVDAAAASPPARGTLRFVLADGSAFRGDISDAEERVFTVSIHAAQTCRIEYSCIKAVHVCATGAAAAEKISAVEAEPELNEDVAVIERGSKIMVLRGAVRGIDAEQVLFSWKERELPLPWARLAGVVFARPAPRGASHTVYLRNGDVFNGRVVAGDETVVVLQSSIFQRLTLDWTSIDRIECSGVRLTYLSDLTSKNYEFTPFLLKQWNYGRDRTLAGREIRLGGSLHRKGLAMHSRSSLAYEINGGYRQFAAVVGIADEMAERGDVALAVLGDGRILWRAERVRGGDEPLNVLVDVTGVRELSLHVDYGRDLDLADQVCWGSARLVK